MQAPAAAAWSGSAALPFAAVSTRGAAGVGAASPGVLGGVLLAHARCPGARARWALPLLLPVLLWQAPRPAPGQFELLAADIGQGNAVLVRTRAHMLVYDSRPALQRARAMPASACWCRCCARWTSALDTLVLSHRDSDHTGGAAAVLAHAAAGARC